MEHISRAADVAAAIRDTLAGVRTKAQLGDWAHRAMLANDNDYEQLTFYEHRYILEIHAALLQLLYMTEGPDYELDDAELQAMAERLERIETEQDARWPHG